MPLSRNADLRIVESIQDAALDPALWPEVLRRLARRIGVVAGSLSIEDTKRQTGRSLGRFGYDPSFTDQYVRYFGRLNPMIPLKAELPVGRVVSTSMLMPADEFVRTEYYNDWVRPQHFHGAIGAVLHREGSLVTWLAVVWPSGVGEPSTRDLDVFARFVPHITRSLHVARHLDLAADREHALLQTLMRLSHAVLLVGRQGQVVYANAAAETLFTTDRLLRVVQGRLTFRNADVEASLQRALSEAVADDLTDREGIETLLVPREGRLPLQVSVVSLRAGRADRVAPGSHAAAVVLAVDPEARQPLRVDQVVRVYGLTPAEGRVLGAIVDGCPLAAVARRLGVTRGTAKTHLERIFIKTGTNRQSDLVRLVAMTASPL